MRVLGHIHAFNDEDVIDLSLRALANQTYPVQEILLVDNGSTDSTLKRTFPQNVTLIRHPENRGTSGAVATGMRYAIEHGYEWIWIFDADSAPRSDALEKLLQLYQTLPADLQLRTWLLASLPMDTATGVPRYGSRFPGSDAPVDPGAERFGHECDITIWSGSLYRLEAVRHVGLPREDYVLDWGEFEYAYRGKRLGYRTFMHPDSIVDHDLGGQLSLTGFPSYRLYYYSRNAIYFWLHEYHGGDICRFLFRPPSIFRLLLRPFLMSGKGRREMGACFRGIRDGLLKKTHHRF